MSTRDVSRWQLLGAALLFSTGGAAIKACTLTGWQVASFRSAVAAVALWVLLPAARTRPTPWLVATGLGYAATLVLFAVATKMTTAASAIFLQSTAPLYLIALAPWLLQEQLRRVDLLAGVVIAAGLVLSFVSDQAPLATAPHPGTGNWIAAASGLSWALTLMALRRLEREGRALGAVVIGNVLAFLLALPGALPVARVSAVDAGVLLYLGTVQVGLAYVLLTAGLKRVPAAQAALLLMLEPALNPVWAWLLQGERPAAGVIGGGALVLLGSLCASWPAPEPARANQPAV